MNNTENTENIYDELYKNDMTVIKQNLEALKGEIIFDKNEKRILIKLPFD